MQSKCHCKLNSSQVSIRPGLNAWRNPLRLRKSSSVVNWICSRTTYRTCKRNCKNAKSFWKPIFKANENYSLVFILCLIQHSLKFFHKVLSQLQSKRTLKNCLMQSQRSNLANQIKKEAMRRPLSQSSNKQVVPRKCP